LIFAKRTGFTTGSLFIVTEYLAKNAYRIMRGKESSSNYIKGD